MSNQRTSIMPKVLHIPAITSDDKITEIYKLMYASSMPTEEIVYFLFRFLYEHAGNNYLNVICKQSLTPWLVDYLKYFERAIPEMRIQFETIETPQYDKDGLARMMKLLYGKHRQAARYFLNAINHEIPDETIIHALHQVIKIPADPESDPDARFGTFEDRGIAINRLLDYRDDIPQTHIFSILLHIAINMNSSFKDLLPDRYKQTLKQLNLQLIKYLVAKKNDIIDVIRQKLQYPDEVTAAPRQTPSYYTNMTSLTASMTDENELSRAFTENDEIQHPAMDLNELLLRIQSLA
jgi:hypothetical protein